MLLVKLLVPNIDCPLCDLPRSHCFKATVAQLDGPLGVNGLNVDLLIQENVAEQEFVLENVLEDAQLGLRETMEYAKP